MKFLALTFAAIVASGANAIKHNDGAKPVPTWTGYDPDASERANVVAMENAEIKHNENHGKYNAAKIQ